VILLEGALANNRRALSVSAQIQPGGSTSLVASRNGHPASANSIGLARTAKAPWVRIPAVGKLLDVNRLEAIARVDPDPKVRDAALARIAELKRKD
jgi:hypothetical protein